MSVAKSKAELTKESSQESIRTWAARSYVGNRLREQLKNADALIVPNEGLGDQEELVYFPEGTEEVLRFLQSSASDGLTVDIVIEEKDYKELSLRADWLMIAALVVKVGVAPILVGLLSEYIKKRLGNRIDNTIVKSSITVSDEETKRSVAITYEGPASTYREVMGKAVKNMSLPADPPSVKRISTSKKRQPRKPK